MRIYIRRDSRACAGWEGCGKDGTGSSLYEKDAQRLFHAQLGHTQNWMRWINLNQVSKRPPHPDQASSQPTHVHTNVVSH